MKFAGLTQSNAEVCCLRGPLPVSLAYRWCSRHIDCRYLLEILAASAAVIMSVIGSTGEGMNRSFS